jgi:hypothetical protein
MALYKRIRLDFTIAYVDCVDYMDNLHIVF